MLPVFLKLLEKRKKQGIVLILFRDWLWGLSVVTNLTNACVCVCVCVMAACTEIIDMSFVQSQNRAFVDPNDPTVIYIAQPVKPKDSSTTRST